MKSHYVLAGLAILGATGWWSYSTRAPSQAEGRTRDDGSTGQFKDARTAAPSAGRAKPEASATVERLREELRQKDELLKNVLAGKALEQQIPEMLEEQYALAARNAASKLDQRLFDAPRDDAEAARLEGALARITGGLPKDVKTEMVCASTLCRLVLHGEDASLARASNHVADGVPKLFAGTVVLSTAEGQRTMYLARETALLDLSTTSAPL